MELEKFYKNIPNNSQLSSSQIIEYFAYFILLNNEYFKAKDITQCFFDLKLTPYSNISQYLSLNSKGTNSKFLKYKNGYVLHRNTKLKLEKKFSCEQEIIITKDLIDLSVITSIPNTPYYIKLIAEQMCGCYDNGLYTACLGMMRKLIETLIIEQFERYGIQEEIKDNNGDFYHLSILIEKYENNSKWSTSINLKKNFKKIKKYGDLSVHNRRFFAKKTDIDDFKEELRIAVQEIIFAIDYSNWNRD